MDGAGAVHYRHECGRADARHERGCTALRKAAEQKFGQSGLTNSEILDRLRQSGMTRGEMRARLQQEGYDPGLADRYFDSIESGTEAPRGDPSADFVQALSRVGLMGGAPVSSDSTRADSSALAMHEKADSTRGPDADTLGDRNREVFGIRVFRRATSQFQPALFGPVDAGYLLGPGDEMTLVLTGDVEEAYKLQVDREGAVFIPDVGQVSVNGLTLGQFNDLLYTRLARVYSGISRSSNATTRFHVAMGRLRANQISVMGDVARPGSYQISSASGLYDALYHAGGPTTDGSFRRVEVYRGAQLVETADLYDFLIKGSGAGDVRLESGDRVFVPPAGPQVRIEGAVRRPMVYEMRPGEGVSDLIAFAGGLRSDALLRRIQIDRVVPPSEQRPGYYRTLVDVDVAKLASNSATTQPLHDGDLVTVSAVSDVRRNRLWVEGEVRNPGLYEWSPGSTLWSVLQRADGLGEEAYTARAHIYRYEPSDGTRRMLQVSLQRDANGKPLNDPALADNDSIVVLSRGALRVDEFVTIKGFVKQPDTYALAHGMTLRDLILAADGFTEGADVVEAEISRLPDPLKRTDTTAYVIRVPLTNTAKGSTDGDPLARWLPEAGEVVLQPGDRVFVRRAPGYEAVREVTISGEVLTPGRYTLTTREDRLLDVLKRAGGVTSQAYPDGMRVVRGGHIVAADLKKALGDPDDRNNIVLTAGDSIFVPAYDPTVMVTGAVNFSARVLYAHNKPLDYYIAQAGGYADHANSGKVTVTYPNGKRATVSATIFGRNTPDVKPGSQIFVPLRPEGGGGTNWDQFIGRFTALLGAVATAVFAASQIH